MDHTLLNYEAAATSRALPSRAYARAETVADVHDLIDLAVGGVDIFGWVSTLTPFAIPAVDALDARSVDLIGHVAGGTMFFDAVAAQAVVDGWDGFVGMVAKAQ